MGTQWGGRAGIVCLCYFPFFPSSHPVGGGGSRDCSRAAGLLVGCRGGGGWRREMVRVYNQLGGKRKGLWASQADQGHPGHPLASEMDNPCLLLTPNGEVIALALGFRGRCSVRKHGRSCDMWLVMLL